MSKETKNQTFIDALGKFCNDMDVFPLVCLCENKDTLASFFNIAIPKNDIIKALRQAADNLENDLPADIKIHHSN